MASAAEGVAFKKVCLSLLLLLFKIVVIIVSVPANTVPYSVFLPHQTVQIDPLDMPDTAREMSAGMAVTWNPPVHMLPLLTVDLRGTSHLLFLGSLFGPL